MSTLSGRARNYLQQLKQQFFKLSPRERASLVVAGVLLILFIGNQIYIPVHEIFADQTKVVEDVEKDLRTAPFLLERYQKLKSRRDEIEKVYERAEVKEGELSHLESLVKNEAKVQNGFTIRNKEVSQFGQEYEQAPFSIKFQTNSLQNLVHFLEEVVGGKQPLFLTRLDIQRGKNAEVLDVDLDVSTIRKMHQGQQ